MLNNIHKLMLRIYIIQFISDFVHSTTVLTICISTNSVSYKTFRCFFFFSLCPICPNFDLQVFFNSDLALQNSKQRIIYRVLLKRPCSATEMFSQPLQNTLLTILRRKPLSVPPPGGHAMTQIRV